MMHDYYGAEGGRSRIMAATKSGLIASSAMLYSTTQVDTTFDLKGGLSMRRLVLVLLLAALPSLGLSATYVVNPDGSGDYPTIQAAIDAAVDGDTIELTDGTFTGSGNRDINYAGKAITVRSQSGNPEASIIDCEGSQSDLHRGFDFHSGEGPQSVLEGVTITNGYADWDFPDDRGGAVRCKDLSSPTLTNCVFSGNWGHRGGAVSCDSASPIVTGCVFRQNAAWYAGGGMRCNYDSDAILENCGFVENSTDNYGGGISCYQSSPTLNSCEFIGHTSDCGGALCFNECTPSTLSDCTFYGNIATGSGGAMRCVRSSPALTNCEFSENTVNGSGGGMYCDDHCSPSLTECGFSNNQAGHGGAVRFTYMCSPAITNCDFHGNTAYRGGAMNFDTSTSSITGCVFSDNSAWITGGGINYNFNYFSSSGTLTNCTLYLNSAGEHGGGIYCSSGATPRLQRTIIAFCVEGAAVACDEYGGDAVLLCCDLYGNAGGDWVDCIEDQYGIEGNFSADPAFCGPAEFDLTLHSDSPCLPGNHPHGAACGLIGARDVGCGLTAAEQTTWGQLKARFRD
jgi:hypothetical protein